MVQLLHLSPSGLVNVITQHRAAISAAPILTGTWQQAILGSAQDSRLGRQHSPPGQRRRHQGRNAVEGMNRIDFSLPEI